MLGLDVNTLTVADYEIIARIERIVNAYNATGILPVSVQRVLTPTPPSSSNYNYEFLSSQFDSNGSERPMSPSKHQNLHQHPERVNPCLITI